MFLFVSRILSYLYPPPRLTNVHQRDRRVRLQLERLEDRLVPANIVVTTTADNPNGPLPNNQVSLRDAITQANLPANAGSTITFQAGLNGTIQLQKALPNISQNTTIKGPGFETLDVSGGGAQNPFTVFDINQNVTAAISGLTVTNGYVNGANGGGIYNSGNLTLTSDFIYFNQAVVNGAAGGGGGGIFNGSGDSLTLSGTDLSENEASNFGGGIANLGSLVCYASQIFSNGASSGGGISNIQNVLNVNVTTKLLANTQIYSNEAQQFGGGIYEDGGDVTMSGFTSGGKITGNEAAVGGGIYVRTGSLTLTFDILLGNNTATNNGGGLFLADVGGQIPAANASLNDVTIMGNKAGGQGPGIYQQGNAVCNEVNVTDTDDPGGNPVKGP
jgi:hypothetical protein